MGKPNSAVWGVARVLDGLLTENIKVYMQAGCVERRAAFSAALGLGNCDGKQLLRQLNIYGFEHQHVTDALAAVES